MPNTNNEKKPSNIWLNVKEIGFMPGRYFLTITTDMAPPAAPITIAREAIITF